jgi:hypothetical protein
MQRHHCFCQGNLEASLVLIGWLRCQYIQFCLGLLGPTIPFGIRIQPLLLFCILPKVGFHTALAALIEKHVFVTWREALLNVSHFLLATEDGYDSEGCRYFKTQIC